MIVYVPPIRLMTNQSISECATEACYFILIDIEYFIPFLNFLTCRCLHECLFSINFSSFKINLKVF